MRTEIAGAKVAVPLTVGATAMLVAMGAAYAGELKIPRDHPMVVLDVPDNWTIERSSFAVEMRAPEKNSIVVASVLSGGRGAVDEWSKQAGERLKAFGIAFDTNAKAPSKGLDAPKAPGGDGGTSAFTTSPDAFTFSGAPSLKTPGTTGSNKPVKPSDNSIESLTGFGTTVTPKPNLPFKAVQIYGASLNGQAVDVQLVIYSLPADHIFVMMQESGSDDGRAVALALSVRGAK